MAEEINWSLGLNASKNGQQAMLDKSGTLNLVSQQMSSTTQTIGTTAEAVSLPADLTASGAQMMALFNMDATNYVEVALDSAVATPFAKLLPGQGMILPPYSGAPTYYAKANTAACDLAVVAVGS